MSKFKKNDKVILKSDEGKKKPNVMIVLGQLIPKTPPDDYLNERANILGISEDSETYLCTWMSGKKEKSQPYEAESLVAFVWDFAR